MGRTAGRVLATIAIIVAALSTAPSARAADPVFVVTNTADSGAGSLRDAIDAANASPGPSTIAFNIPTTDAGFNGQWFTIQPLLALNITGSSVNIDGATQTAFTGDTNPLGPEVFVDGRSMNPSKPGFVITGDHNVLQGLTVSGFPNRAIGIGAGTIANIVRGNYIGTDPTGRSAIPNDVNGCCPALIDNGVGTIIGGTQPGDGNVISGNVGPGVGLAAGSRGAIVHGNRIGTDTRGTYALPNGIGILVGGPGVGGDAVDSIIGGPTPGAGNLISGNRGDGVFVTGPGHVIQGNLIGTDATGSVALPNQAVGVRLVGGANTLIGGVTSAARNVISGNAQSAIAVDSSNGTVVQGNLLGTTASGTAALGNSGNGVTITTSPSTTIGGITPGAGNVISGNLGGKGGILAFTTDHLTIQGNRIGTDVQGSAAIANQGRGLNLFDVADALVGGTDPGARNLISGNAREGIGIAGSSTRVAIQGNFIGTDLTGGAPLGNASDGIFVSGSTDNLGNPTGPAASNNVIANNVVSGNGGGIHFESAANNVVRGNRIGTDAAGSSALGNNTFGVFTGLNSTGNIVGGPTAADRNVISANLNVGLKLGGTGTVVEGNYIGVDASGSRALGNGFGVPAGKGPGIGLREIGGVIAGNVISGNQAAGLDIFVPVDQVVGNMIGTDASGSAAIPNGRDGIRISASDVVIGGPSESDRNVISGNSMSGISSFGTSRITIQGNYIGTDATGSVAVRNVFNGIQIVNATDVAIGGTKPGTGNVISGNGDVSIGQSRAALALSSVRGAIVQGNLVGTDATGTFKVANVLDGIGLHEATTGALVGGTTPGARNVISGNGRAGIALVANGLGPDRNAIIGNLIGVDVSGLLAIGNEIGVDVFSGMENSIGGSGPSEGNVISGNESAGVALVTREPLRTRVRGNRIGTDLSGSVDLGNGIVGVLLASVAGGDLIGGTAPGEANLIAFNRGAGVAVVSAPSGTPVEERISGNAIFSNKPGAGGVVCRIRCGGGIPLAPGAGLGIDLNADGVTPNDPGDADAGPNWLQNFPVIGTTEVATGIVTVTGALDTQSPSTATVEIFGNDAADPSANGEGQRYIVTAAPAANGCFTATFPASAADGFFTTTATDAAGNTSEFSRAIPQGATKALMSLLPATAVNVIRTSHTVIATLTNTAGGPVPCAAVTFAVSGVNSASATATTDINGTATFTYVGVAAGRDTIIASSGNVSGQATKTWTLPPGTAGLLVLNGTAGGALTVSGGAKITVNGADLVVDSTATNGATASGGSIVTVNGGVIKTASGAFNGSYVGTLVQGSLADPLAGYARPSTATLPAGSSYTGTDGLKHYRPGIYNSGITVSGGSSAVLDSGLYVLRGGGLVISGGSAISGDAVTIFNTGASYPSGGSCGKVDLSGASRYTMTSPTVDVYTSDDGRSAGQGMLIFQDPVCTATVTLSGGSSAVANGTIYAPTAPMTISGGSAVLNVQIIVNRLTASGSATNITFEPSRIATFN